MSEDFYAAMDVQIEEMAKFVQNEVAAEVSK